METKVKGWDRWTDYEDFFLKKNYGKLSNNELRNILKNRSNSAILNRAIRLGIHVPKFTSKPNPELEDKIIKTFLSTGESAKVIGEMCGTSKSFVDVVTSKYFISKRNPLAV